MGRGVICACCGEKAFLPESDGDGSGVVYMCQPCVDEPNAEPPDLSVYTIPVSTTVVSLDAAAAFDGLTAKERRYAHALSRADWEGAKICLLQCSPESAPIFCLLQLVFSAQPVADLVAAAKDAGLTPTELDQGLIYAAAFYGNMGNYKSFGDTKFVPALAAKRFKLLLSAGQADAAAFSRLWAACADRMYSLPPRQRQMGLGSAAGISTYFSANCTEEDAAVASRFLESISLSPYNTRLFKTAERAYTVRIASAVEDARDAPADDAVGAICREHSFEGCAFTVRRGDYAPLMARVVSALEEAVEHAANERQQAMLRGYVRSFALGSIDAHKDGSREWIKDKGPAVESYIGFIESYRDPSGARGEWEGFVACVNRETSRKFQALVDGAEEMLRLMPWPSEYEKDAFLRPDFTSLEVLAFGSSGVPAGINIPNYDDIRQAEGFKNVSLGNVLAASYGSGDKPVTFVSPTDQEPFKRLKVAAFELQVGVHELLGHGSGKLYHAGTPDAEKIAGSAHPLTGNPVSGPFYAAGATWDTTFGKLASSYEECRAECTGLYLCLEPSVLTVFGHAAADGVHEIAYVNWLLMVRGGLTGLEFYTPETKGWRQAHMRARYVILRVLIEAGLVTLERLTGDDCEPDVRIHLDRQKIATAGRDAIGKFLLALQVHKSLADLPAATALYEHYSEVGPDMDEIRSIVMARKEPRKLLVQPHLHVDEASVGGVGLRTFDASPRGMIESFVARYRAADVQLMELHARDLPHVADD